jgi:hypothetical protein
MNNFPGTIWHRRPAKARRQAATQAIAENLATTSPMLSPDESIEVGQELASMRSLIQVLEQLPGTAWTQERNVATAASPAREASRRYARWRPAGTTMLHAGLLATAALAFVIGALLHPFSGGPHARSEVSHTTPRVLLEPLRQTLSTSQAIAYMPGGDQMLIRLYDLPRSAPGTYYELWLMTNNTDLVSVTSFRIRSPGTKSLRLLLPSDPSRYRYLDISVQHVGDGGAISHNNILRGAI